MSLSLSETRMFLIHLFSIATIVAEAEVLLSGHTLPGAAWPVPTLTWTSTEPRNQAAPATRLPTSGTINLWR